MSSLTSANSISAFGWNGNLDISVVVLIELCQVFNDCALLSNRQLLSVGYCDVPGGSLARARWLERGLGWVVAGVWDVGPARCIGRRGVWQHLNERHIS